MTTHGKKQPVRHVPNSLVSGQCMDCHAAFNGSVALHVVLMRGMPHIEVLVVGDNQMHALCRVPMTLLPVIGE